MLHLALESRPSPEHRSNRSGSRTQSGRGTVSRQRHNERVMPPHLDAPFRAPRGAICDNGIFHSPSVSTDLRSRHGAVRFGGYSGGVTETTGLLAHSKAHYQSTSIVSRFTYYKKNYEASYTHDRQSHFGCAPPPPQDMAPQRLTPHREVINTCSHHRDHHPAP